MARKLNKPLACSIAFIILAVAVCCVLLAPVFCALYGNNTVRQRVMNDWVNQKNKLSHLQEWATIRLLYNGVDDPHAVDQALAVLSSHLGEDEDEIVRHLAYVSLTTENPNDCGIALSGLLKVSPRHRKIATAVFKYQLNHADLGNKENALMLSYCVSGLEVITNVECLETIKQLTNNPSKYLSGTAQDAVARLQTNVPTKSQ
jgi:hypothetical protein